VEEAFSAIATPDGYARLMEGVAEVAIEMESPQRWRARLVAPSSATSIEELVDSDLPARTLRIRRGPHETSFRAEEREGTSWLIRTAILDGPRLDLLRNDSMRGRIAGSLAVDLLGWARRLG
jgi:hypothetical protein